MFHVFFFVCDGVGAVDLPQRVHIFRFSLQFKALCSNVDVIQHVKKCLKLQREAKIWTRCGRSKAFSVIQKTKETEETEEKKGR